MPHGRGRSWRNGRRLFRRRGIEVQFWGDRDIDEAATFALVDPGKGVDEVTVINIDVEALQRCAKQDLFKHLETWVHRGYHLEQDLPLPGADAKEKSFFACSCDKFGVGS